MGTSQQRPGVKDAATNFNPPTRTILDQIGLNPTQSDLKKYIFQLGQPMSLPLPQSQRVKSKTKCEVSRDAGGASVLASRSSTFSVRISAFDVRYSIGKVDRAQSCPIVPNRAQSCPIVPNRSWGAGLWTLDLGPWTLDLGLWTLDFGLWTLDFGL